MFKVLVIAYYYPPLGLSGVQRTLKFTKYFYNFNWESTVITTGKSGYFAHDSSLLNEALNSNVNILRTESLTPNRILKRKGTVKMPSSFLMKMIGRISKTFFIPDNKIFWSKKAAKIAKKLINKEKYDAIFVSIPPFSSIVSIAKLKKQFDIPIFVDYRDAWLENQFRFYPTPYHKFKHKKLEDTILRKCERVIVVNRLIKEGIIKTHPFLKFKDVDIIPHGFDPKDFENLNPVPKENDKLIISYSGSFYEGISPKFLLHGFKQLTIEKPDVASNIEFHFIGHFKRENQKLVKKLHLEKFVKEIGYLSHLESLRRIIASDILWIMLPNSVRMSNVTPGKIFEYFGTKKPIFANLPDGIAKTVIKEYQASFITKPDNLDEIKNSFIKIHELYVNKKLPIPKEEFVERYNKRNQTEQLTNIFQFYLKAE